MAYTIRLVPVVALLLLGCASGTTSLPASHATTGADDRTAAELVAQGKVAAAYGDTVRAEQYLSLAIERGAERREILPLLLRACVQSLHLRAALNHAEPYLLEHPKDDALRYLVANIHLGLGQDELARRELWLLLESDANNANAHYLLGILESDRDIDAAREHFALTLKHSRELAQRAEVQGRLTALLLRERRLEEQPVEDALQTAGVP